MSLDDWTFYQLRPTWRNTCGNGGAYWILTSGAGGLRIDLTSGQRAVLALELLPLLEEKAHERRTSGKKTVPQSKGKAAQHAAKILRTNADYVSKIKSIEGNAPELIEEIRSGNLKIPEASELAKLPPSKRRKALARTGNKSYLFQAGSKANKRPTVIHTPPGICQFLHDTISEKYDIKTILDPCAGEGNLTQPWRSRKRKIIEFEISNGTDFFDVEEKIRCDLVLCNPPFAANGKSKESPVKLFLEKILEVVPKRTPIVLFTPWSFRSDQTLRSSRWKWLRDECPLVSTIISLPCDCWFDARAHSEILMFNMRKLNPHYFLEDKYLE